MHVICNERTHLMKTRKNESVLQKELVNLAGRSMIPNL